MTIRVGINGFGRIGRCVARLCAESPDVEIVAVNDILDDPENLAYLYNYDSTYGRAEKKATRVNGNGTLAIEDKEFQLYAERDIANVPWDRNGVDIVIDSSGVRTNVAGCQKLVAKDKVKKAVVTHLPDGDIDRALIMGVNDGDYDPDSDHVVSSVICDANAIAHVLAVFEEKFGIEGGFITTLHPWLAYQNLVDRGVSSQSNPGHFWKDYSLGRASIGTMIPKETTAINALRPVMADVVDKVHAFSYRVPTGIVASADLTLKLKDNPGLDAIVQSLETYADNSPYVSVNYESLTAIDYLATPWSAIIDMQWTALCDDMVKVVLWYDNEWGYSNRVVDVVRHVAN
jgi:glyceraldehyde 3-phosphate dehydrogenase